MKIKKQKAQKSDNKLKKKLKSEKLKFEDYKNYLGTTQLENKLSHPEKFKIYVDSLKEDHKEFIKNNKLKLNTQQRFKSENSIVFTEEIKKIALIETIWFESPVFILQKIGHRSLIIPKND